MSLATTMTELANAAGLDRKYDWPSESIQPPCVLVSYPELDPNIIFTGGKAENVYPVYIIVGKVSEHRARDLISGYLQTVPALLNAVDSATIDYVTVDSVKLREVRVADASYLAAVFSCSVMEAI